MVRINQLQVCKKLAVLPLDRLRTLQMADSQDLEIYLPVVYNHYQSQHDILIRMEHGE